MSYRNKNLVFTNEDMMIVESEDLTLNSNEKILIPNSNEKTLVPNLKRKRVNDSETNNKKQKIETFITPRRSMRLANRINCVMDKIDPNITVSESHEKSVSSKQNKPCESIKTNKATQSIKTSKPCESIKTNKPCESIKTSKPCESKKSSETNESIESETIDSDESNNSSDSDFSDDELSESDIDDELVDFIVKDSPKPQRKKFNDAKNLLSSVFVLSEKNKQNNEIGEEFDDALEQLIDEPWFEKMSKVEKKYYVEKMQQLIKPVYEIPTVKDIMDMKIDTSSIKTLILDRKDLEEYDKLSEDFDEACQKFVQKMKYLTNSQYVQKQEQIKILEKNILEQQKFVVPLRDRILDSDYSDAIKAIMYDKYMMISGLDPEDSVKYHTWIETALSVPSKPKKIKLDDTIPQNVAISKLIIDMMNKLNEKIYGMTEAKEEFLCIIANMIANPKSKHKAIGLYGPPGIGKTMIAKVLSEVLELPMEQISLGGVTDSSFLEGHGFTYVGSEPGSIVKAAIKMKCTNGIIYLDELDKISKTEKGKEIEHALLHITDFTQNHNFRDKYMPEIPIDLSDHFFIYSMNTIHELDSALASRIPVIRFDGYNAKEKIQIVSEYILPEILSNYGMTTSDIILPLDSIEYMIQFVKEEDEVNGKSGVRGLKKALNRIINRVNLYRLASVDGKINIKLSFDIQNFKMPYTINNILINSIVKNSEQSYCLIDHMYN